MAGGSSFHGSYGGGFRGGYGGYAGGYRGSRYYGNYGYRGYGYRGGYYPWVYSSFAYSSYWPGFYGYGYYPYYSYPYYSYPYSYSYPYAYSSPASYSYPASQPSSNVVVVYPRESATPALHSYDEYGQEVRRAPEPANVSDASPLYLFAFADHEIRAAIAYWVNGSTLHYVTLEHTEKQVPLASVDRPLTARLNRDRRVALPLPSVQ
jgi:hypothetical protein